MEMEKITDSDAIEEIAKNEGISEIPTDDIIPNRFQPRTIFDDEKIEELSRTIHIHGIIQPIVVRALEDGGFEIEIILEEAPSVCALPIEDAQDLDFFDQPKLSPKEIAEVPFGLKTSSAPLRSTPRPKRTTK